MAIDKEIIVLNWNKKNGQLVGNESNINNSVQRLMEKKLVVTI